MVKLMDNFKQTITKTLKKPSNNNISISSQNKTKVLQVFLTEEYLLQLTLIRSGTV